MRRYFLSAAIIVVLLCQGSVEADDVKVDRSLGREPAYGSKPQYCLLLFGPQGKFKVWLAVAGEEFYADKNGDGDLAASGKRIYSVGNARLLTFLDPDIVSTWLPVPENERIYQVGDIFEPNTRTWYNLTVRRSGDLKSAEFEFMVTVQQRYRQFGRLSRLADTAEKAPVLHFGGPLTLGLFTRQLVRGASNDLAGWVGTTAIAGTADGPTYVVHDSAIPRYVFPVAWIDFPVSAPGRKPIRASADLNRRDGLMQFSGRILVPSEAQPGNAAVMLLMPNWTRGNVQRRTVMVHVVDRAEAQTK